MDRIRMVAIRFLGFTLLLVLAACVSSNDLAGRAASGSGVGPAGPQGERGVAGPAGKDGKPGKDYMPPPGNGLKMKISGVEIPENQRPIVILSVTDENGLPISAQTLEGYGFTMAQVEEDQTTHLTRDQSLLVHEVDGKSYQWQGETKQPVLAKTTQAFADTGGAWIEAADPGVYTYQFANPLSKPVNPDLVTMVGVYGWKNNRQAVANDVFSYVQGGTNSIPERQVVTNSACNLCHNPLKAHGGTRTQVALCVTCHTDQTVDPETGNDLNFKVLVHRLHFGKQLPSVQAGKPYLIVGHNQTVLDLSKDTWPQDLRYCITCHTGGAQSNNYKTSPNAEACTACHDATNLATGDNHPGGKQADTQCPACHAAEGSEFDASITGAHTVPANAKRLAGLALQISAVEGMKPGSAPVVKFKITNRASEPLDPAKLGYLAVTLAGPTSDYQNRWTETLVSADNKDLPPLKVNDAGQYEYKMKASLPEDATGTYAIGMEGYVMENAGSRSDPIRVAAYNPVTYVSLDGGTPDPRREVVDQTKCNVCHMNVTAHGTVRQNLEYCVMCHNANGTDEARRPAEAMPPTTINFPLLIHRLHRGETATHQLQVYGFGNQLNDFRDVVFPGDLAACQTCHTPGTYGLPLPKGVQPTTITQSGSPVSTILPIRAVCTSCHDNDETAAHADLQTSAKGVESCLVCHGPGREADVTKVHH